MPFFGRARFRCRFDAVVMLTMSNWFTEMRSNRYHFASRLARLVPVVFAQPDALETAPRAEPTELEGVTVLHLHCAPGELQDRALAEALRARGIRRPLFWVYNADFASALTDTPHPVVYHATEHWLGDNDGHFGLSEAQLERIRAVLRRADLTVAVSQAVADRCAQEIGDSRRVLLSPNGCDYRFWSAGATPAAGDQPLTAFYGGGLYWKVDLPLLEGLAERLPDWTLQLCGEVHGDPAPWERLFARPNVRFAGRLSPPELRALAYRATAGIIPYVDSALTAGAAPLKAHEYLAVGLPVITAPIAALAGEPQLFRAAQGADGFAAALRELAPSRHDPRAIARRRRAARRLDYDRLFARVLARLLRLRR